MHKDISKLTLKELKEYQIELKNNISKYKNLQMAKKVTLNSAYGTLGSQYFAFYDINLAEAITLTGQYVSKSLYMNLNEFLNQKFDTSDVDYLIAGDTDSIYLHLDAFFKPTDKNLTKKQKVELLDAFCEAEIQPVINKTLQDISEYTNAYKPFLKMKREAIAERGIFTGKKRYALTIWDNEGVKYEEPKLKVTGFSMISSATPTWCKAHLKECLNIIMTGTEKELTEYVKTVREEFKTLSIHHIAIPKGVNGLKKYTLTSPSLPINTRASLIFNKFIKHFGLQKDYQYIKDSDRIKYCYIKEPNMFRSNVIGFIDSVPPEFDFEIDYMLQFQKIFLQPLDGLLKPIGWMLDRPKKLNFKRKV